MNFEYTILPKERLIMVRLEGPFFLSELADSASVICADDRYCRNFDGFIDLTGVVVEITPRDVKSLITYTLARPHYGEGRWAILVTTPIATAFAMLYTRGLATRHQLSLFCTLEGAARYLERTIDRRFFEGIPVTTRPSRPQPEPYYALQA